MSSLLFFLLPPPLPFLSLPSPPLSPDPALQHLHTFPHACSAPPEAKFVSNTK